MKIPDIDSWVEIFKRVRVIRKAEDTDSVSVAPFTIEDVAEVVAVQSGNPGTWPWHGIFLLKDSRAVMIWASLSRLGWDDTTSRFATHIGVDVASTVNKLWMRPNGDTGFALSSQFGRWRKLRYSDKLRALLENSDYSGWSKHRLTGDRNSSDSMLWALDEEVELARYNNWRDYKSGDPVWIDGPTSKRPCDVYVQTVFGSGSTMSFAVDRLAPPDFSGFERVLCEKGHFTYYPNWPKQLSELPTWACSCGSHASWYSPINTTESPPGCFAKCFIGSMGLEVVTAAVKKTCDLGHEHEIEAVTYKMDKPEWGWVKL